VCAVRELFPLVCEQLRAWLCSHRKWPASQRRSTSSSDVYLSMSFYSLSTLRRSCYVTGYQAPQSIADLTTTPGAYNVVCDRTTYLFSHTERLIHTSFVARSIWPHHAPLPLHSRPGRAFQSLPATHERNHARHSPQRQDAF
jgi:hypothetical protein